MEDLQVSIGLNYMLNLSQDGKLAIRKDVITTFFLYEIFYTETESIKWTNWDENYVKDGKVYEVQTISSPNIVQSNDGKINGLSLEIGNAERQIQFYIEKYDLQGKVVKITEVIIDNKKLVGENEVTYRISSIKTTKDKGTIGLSIGLDFLKIQCPNRKMLSRYCGWKFRGPECKYAGDDKECNRTLDDCFRKYNSANFGGFPGITNERMFF